MELQQGITYDQTVIDLLPGEVWLPVLDCVVPDVKPYYYISNKGRVWSTYLNRFLKQGFDKVTGYLSVVLVTYSGKNAPCLVHRLEMMVFCMIPGYEKLYVNHKDGNKTNNDITNLEWTTPSENELHAYRTGLKSSPKGEDSTSSKYKEWQIRKICEGLEQRLPFKEIAISAGMEPTKASTDYICRIKQGKLWGHISKEYNIVQNRNDQIFLDSEIHQICRLLELKLYTDHQIVYMIKPECSTDTEYTSYKRAIGYIRNRYYYTRISKDYNF